MRVAIWAAALTMFSLDAHAQPRAVTFAKDVAPILFTACGSCHRPDGGAPFALLTLAVAVRQRGELDAIPSKK